MRNTVVVALVIIALAAAACSGGTGSSTITPTIGAPTARATAQPSSPTAGPATAAASPAAISTFPARCSALAVDSGIDILAAQHLQLAADTVAGRSGPMSQLVCRFQGAGTTGDTAIIVVAARYADVATATREDRLLRTTAEAQGGKFTKVDGLEDEAYSLAYPSLTGVAARRGNATVSIGVGKLLGVPGTAEYTTLIKSILDKVGM